MYNVSGRATPFLYNGRDGVMREANGLYHMRARYYHPEVRRFVNRDILRDSVDAPKTLNRYAYVEGNPIKSVDPRGESAIAVLGGVTSGLMCLPVPGSRVAGTVLLIGLLIFSNSTDNEDSQKPCPPCKTVSGRIVPLGTIAHRPLDTPPPGRIEHGILGPHYNIYRANQAPRNSPRPCKCFWQSIGAVPPGELPPGAIPIEPFAN